MKSCLYKPTCSFIGNCLFILIAVPVGAALLILLFALFILIWFCGGPGFLFAIMEIIQLITISVGLDDNGKYYNYIFNDKHNDITMGLEVLLNYKTMPYDKIIASSFGALGVVLAVILLVIVPLLFIISCVYSFIIDIKNGGIPAFKRAPFVWLCILIPLYFLIALIPLLLNFIVGIIAGILLLFELTPLGKFDNYTLYNSFIIPKQSYYTKTYDIGTILGFVMAISSIFLFLQFVVNSFRKDIVETIHDIEADIELKVEKKK